jgi:two-component system phosphate regulon sensor histidine kinase PhoR
MHIITKIFRILKLKVSPKKLIKGTALIAFAPGLITFAFYYNGLMQFTHAVSFMASIFILAVIFVYPYLKDLSELTNYVRELAKDNKPKKPELSFLNNVEELSDAVNNLNDSWEQRKLYLQALIAEDKILINSLPDIIIMLDNDLKPIQTNKASKELLGEKRFEFGIMKIISDSNISDSCTKVQVTGKGEVFQFNLGEPFYLDFIAKIEKFPVNSPNNISVVVILQNITDQKRTERLLSDFVANASHEIRTPLASISGFLETLLEVENEPEMQRKFLEIMRDQSERIEKLVTDLLTLSNIQAGAGKTKFCKFALLEALDKSLQGLGKIIADKKVKITKNIKTQITNVTGNFDEVARVCENLISNAIKYSSSEKLENEIIVTIEDADNFEIQDEKYQLEQKFIKFSVQDFGEGIDEAHIPRLTERFFRADKARSSKVSGTGLGLAIVKHILDNHGAVLKVKSKLGEGSTFSIYFPV